MDDDLVLDNETGLVWARDANTATEVKAWQDAIAYCRSLTIGDRMGWRLPTVEELSSLVAPGEQPALARGHPFIYIQSDYYWSSTTYESNSQEAMRVLMHNGFAFNANKNSTVYVWPVRGGNGYASGSWYVDRIRILRQSHRALHLCLG